MRNKGFTLIELLIVIAVVGILSTVVAVTFPTYLKRARDTQRKSDLKQYQVALELYANKNNSTYPTAASGVNLVSLCASLSLSSCPDDSSGSDNYKYMSDGANYVVWAKLEEPSTTKYWLSCANGKTGTWNVLSEIDISCSKL